MANRATGEVERLYVNAGNCYIRLTGVSSTQDRYFGLRQTHQNYNALYSLALAAAINNYPLTIRTVGEMNPNQIPDVQYLVVDW
jgi:hypothetical protein